jgi:phage-related protein (TIGR01555 family)
MLSDWIARRIVSANPYEAFRLGVQASYNGDVDSDGDLVRKVQDECNRLGVWRKCWSASTWGRGYGGTIIHIVTDDDRVEEQLNHDRVNRIYSLDVYDPNEVTPQLATEWNPFVDRDTDLLWPDHEYYTVYASNLTIPNLHPSRVACFGGLLTSRLERQTYYRGWDAPVLQPVWDQLREFQGSNQSITRMLQSSSQAVLKIPRLWSLVVQGGKERLRSRLQAATLASSVGNVLPINDDETMEFVERTFAGIKDLGEFELLLVAGAAEMPATILFGRSPAGLNATGESDTEAWYSSVESRRAADYGPPMIRIVQLIARTMGAQDPDGWGVSWPSLWRLDPLQQAELEERQTMTDDARIAQGMPADVIIRHRYGGGEYRSDPPMLSDADLDALEREPEQMELGLEEPADPENEEESRIVKP